jgi:hypothetical protein
MRDFRFGSKADIGACPRDVRFTPESGHWLNISRWHFLPKAHIVP